jgi:integrase
MHQHEKVRALIRLGKDFVLHSLRHTTLTRLGESGVDAFTIMRIAGHSSVTVSKKYVHPSPEHIERAFEKLEATNALANRNLPEGQNRQLPATIAATLLEAVAVTY